MCHCVRLELFKNTFRGQANQWPRLPQAKITETVLEYVDHGDMEEVYHMLELQAAEPGGRRARHGPQGVPARDDERAAGRPLQLHPQGARLRGWWVAGSGRM